MCCLQFNDNYCDFMYRHQTQVSLTVGVRVENVVQIWKTPPNANGPFSLLYVPPVAARRNETNKDY